MGRVVHCAHIEEMNLHSASRSESTTHGSLTRTVVVLPGYGEMFFSLTDISDRTRRMRWRCVICVGTACVRKVAREDPLRSFTPDGREEVEHTHYDAEPRAPIICVAGY